ncbi:serine/threonine-protein kinase PINK1, mitochondrial [Electrophorus electricus]|uniref:Serine/threonine-protein kinase PINK1, mitochondrial n=1 Tax=Electrophorus electricus TaxID=8005 RepID=A0A4W4DWY8_ELEEL|nr:serine/threonine-protein kinase PINK1, mitochondrial [Electrophorus electricus]
MSVKHALSRGLELGRSLFKLGVLKPASRVAAKFRGERLWVGQPSRGVWPQTFLPARYRYYRTSVRDLAAQLQSGSFRRILGGASPRNRAFFLAFGVGLGLIEQQLDDDRRNAATCQEIQALFRKKTFQSPLKQFASGYKLEDYVIGAMLGKGCNAAVYEAAVRFTPLRESSRCSLVDLKQNGEEKNVSALRSLSSTACYPLALKMMWNIGAGSSSEAILKAMCHELVPADPRALQKEKGEVVLSGCFGRVTKRVTAHPNVIRVYRAFTANVPLLPGAEEDYPAVLPPRHSPAGMGNNRTLFLVMKKYPCTLRQYLGMCAPDHRQASMMLLQLLEAVDHLCRQGVAHRDLKSDNVLLEFESAGCPRLVLTDFGCCLAEENLGLTLPFTNEYVNKGGNTCLMAPEVATATSGPGVEIDYSRADAWAVGAVAYEIFGQTNPFYGPARLESCSYQEWQLPRLPASIPDHTRLVVRLLLRRNPEKRPSARVTANILHLGLWGGKALADLDPFNTGRMADWLLCQSAVALLKGCGPTGSFMEAELQRGFLANLDLEELRVAVNYLIYGRELLQSTIV